MLRSLPICYDAKLLLRVKPISEKGGPGPRMSSFIISLLKYPMQLFGHIAKNCSLRGKCLECRQSGHFQRNCPVRLRRLQRSVDSLDPVPPGDVSGLPPSASPPGAGPPPVVLSGVPPIAPLANQPDGVACEESSSVDVRDNQYCDWLFSALC